MTHVLEANRLSKSFNQAGTPIQVLQGLDLNVSEGETIAVLGQSGSGKSTLLSLLAGLDLPDDGSVTLCGQDVSRLDEATLARFRSKNMGIVFQQFHLMSYLTALENVALPLEISGDASAKASARRTAEELLKRVGLAHRMNHLPSQLSGGEKQRVAIARAIATRPKLILADEPSGNLDNRTGEQIMDLLFEQVSEHRTALILVTHNEDLAGRCSRKVRLENGKLG